MTCPQLIDSGAYVLGALPPSARAAYERHLPGCAECRASVSEMAGLPGLLGRLDPEAVPGPATRDPAPPSVMAGALLRVRRQRRTRRLVASFAALAIAAVALVAGLALPRSHSSAVVAQPVPTTAVFKDTTIPLAPMTPAANAGPVSGQVGMLPVAGGTEVFMTCEYGKIGTPTPGIDYEKIFSLWVVSREHGEQAIGWWKAGPGDVSQIPGVTSWPIAGMKRIELRDQHGVVVLTFDVS